MSQVNFEPKYDQQMEQYLCRNQTTGVSRTSRKTVTSQSKQAFTDAIAIVASFRDRIVDPRTVLIGEVGLGGQVRLVSQMELRLKEAAKLGFKRAIIPKGQTLPDVGLEVIPVARVLDAIIAALPGDLRQSFGEDDDEDMEVN
jgi:hypothetical protein